MEILKSFLLEVGKNSRRLAEHGSRQKVIADDVIVALCSLGINVSEIPSYYWSIQQKNAVSGTQVVTIKNPEVSCSAEPESKRLKVGQLTEKVRLFCMFFNSMCQSFSTNLTSMHGFLLLNRKTPANPFQRYKIDRAPKLS